MTINQLKKLEKSLTRFMDELPNRSSLSWVNAYDTRDAVKSEIAEKLFQGYEVSA